MLSRYEFPPPRIVTFSGAGIGATTGQIVFPVTLEPPPVAGGADVGGGDVVLAGGAGPGVGADGVGAGAGAGAACGGFGIIFCKNGCNCPVVCSQ